MTAFIRESVASIRKRGYQYRQKALREAEADPDAEANRRARLESYTQAELELMVKALEEKTAKSK